MCRNYVQLKAVTQKQAVLCVCEWSFTRQKGPKLVLVMVAVALLVGPGVSVEGGGHGGTEGGSVRRWSSRAVLYRQAVGVLPRALG